MRDEPRDLGSEPACAVGIRAKHVDEDKSWMAESGALDSRTKGRGKEEDPVKAGLRTCDKVQIRIVVEAGGNGW